MKNDRVLAATSPRPSAGQPPESRQLEPCRVEFRQGQVIPGLGGGTKRYADGLYDPESMVAEVEVSADKVVLVSVHMALITVNRPRPKRPAAE